MPWSGVATGSTSTSVENLILLSMLVVPLLGLLILLSLVIHTIANARTSKT
jgi:hypothetical protein